MYVRAAVYSIVLIDRRQGHSPHGGGGGRGVGVTTDA